MLSKKNQTSDKNLKATFFFTSLSVNWATFWLSFHFIVIGEQNLGFQKHLGKSISSVEFTKTALY